VHAPPELGFHLAELRLQSLAHRLPPHCESSTLRLAAAMREAKEVERRRSPFSAPLPARDRVRSEFQQARPSR
jgi:hypothetical protein